MNAKWVLAGMAAAALVLGACGDDDDDDGFRSGDNDGGGVSSVDKSSAATPAVPATGGYAQSLAGGAPPATGEDGAPLPQLETNRKIIFTANLSLESTDVGRSFNDASALARANGGYVEKSQYDNDKDENTKRSASLTIRVPVQNYEALLASLRGMNGVSVDTEGSSSSEVTEQYTDLQSRQRNLERTEQQYLALLNEAKTIQEILTVQDRLNGVRSQIEQIQGRLKVLDDLTDFATVNVTLSAVLAKAEEPKSEGWKLGEVFVESWEGSLEVARYAAAAGIVAFVAGAWLVIPVTLAFLASRRWRHRAGPRPETAAEAP